MGYLVRWLPISIVVVAHRDTPEGIEARQAFISQMAKRAESRGIDFY